MKRPDYKTYGNGLDSMTEFVVDLSDYASKLEAEKKELQQYVEITKESFLDNGFSEDSFTIKQANKLLKL